MARLQKECVEVSGNQKSYKNDEAVGENGENSEAIVPRVQYLSKKAGSGQKKNKSIECENSKKQREDIPYFFVI